MEISPTLFPAHYSFCLGPPYSVTACFWCRAATILSNISFCFEEVQLSTEVQQADKVPIKHSKNLQNICSFIFPHHCSWVSVRLWAPLHILFFLTQVVILLQACGNCAAAVTVQDSVSRQHFYVFYCMSSFLGENPQERGTLRGWVVDLKEVNVMSSFPQFYWHMQMYKERCCPHWVVFCLHINMTICVSCLNWIQEVDHEKLQNWVKASPVVLLGIWLTSSGSTLSALRGFFSSSPVFVELHGVKFLLHVCVCVRVRVCVCVCVCTCLHTSSLFS